MFLYLHVFQSAITHVIMLLQIEMKLNEIFTVHEYTISDYHQGSRDGTLRATCRVCWLKISHVHWKHRLQWIYQSGGNLGN